MNLNVVLNAAVMAAMSIAALGCAKSGPGGAPGTAVVADGHKHDGWWCDEHGVPEEICARCDVTLVADFKAKGDWCDDHNRPDSQCFICHPETQAEFAAQYEAKYGKQPPKPQVDG